MNTESVTLAPANPTPDTRVVPAANLSPAVYLQRLNPEKVIDTDTHMIYWFMKISAKPGYVRALLKDPAIARRCAMISVPRNKPDTFTLQWYPHGEDAQVIVDLPITRLAEVVEDLKAAGF